MRKFLIAIPFVLTLLACIVAGFQLFAVFLADSAPKQAAGAAIAAAIAIIPYCFARSLEAIGKR